jgi:hypothetical protein
MHIDGTAGGTVGSLPGILTADQVRELFTYLKIPLECADAGSPIFTVCPFQSRHTTVTRPRHTRLYFDTHPHLHCLHDSCKAELREFNTYLRLIITGSTEFPLRDEDGTGTRERPDYEYANEVRDALPDILRRFRRRRRKQKHVEIEPGKFLARAFEHHPEGLIWAGLPNSSGCLHHRIHFRSAEEWFRNSPDPAWSFTCPSLFVPGSSNRNNAHVLDLAYLVLESDIHSLEDSAALFEWFEWTFETPLWALVFSGNKSLHAWFYPHPGREWLRLYKPTLEAAGFCRGPLTFSQPVRLAGQIRPSTGQEQSLLWIKS